MNVKSCEFLILGTRKLPVFYGLKQKNNLSTDYLYNFKHVAGDTRN